MAGSRMTGFKTSIGIGTVQQTFLEINAPHRRSCRPHSLSADAQLELGVFPQVLAQEALELVDGSLRVRPRAHGRVCSDGARQAPMVAIDGAAILLRSACDQHPAVYSFRSSSLAESISGRSPPSARRATIAARVRTPSLTKMRRK